MTTSKSIAVTPAGTTPTPAAAASKAAAKPVTVKSSAQKPTLAKKPAAKPTPRKAAVKKPAVKKPAVKSAKTASPSKTVKVEKPKKPKLVRDSFTIPKLEYVVLEALKQRATKLTRSVKKSELLRAGIKALAALSDAAFLSALDRVPAIKTGRPASGK
jgi:hypothetical protein